MKCQRNPLNISSIYITDAENAKSARSSHIGGDAFSIDHIVGRRALRRQ